MVDQLPVVGGTAVVALGLLVGLIRLLLASLSTQVSTLAGELRDERTVRAADHAEMLIQVNRLEALASEQRAEKHRVINEHTKVSLLLGLMIDLAERCVCGVFDPVRDLMARATVNAPSKEDP